MTSPANDTERPKSREELARIEVGVTDVGPGVKWTLTLFFIALMVCVPLIDQFLAYRSDGKLPVAGVAHIAGATRAWSEADESRSTFAKMAAVNAEALRRIQAYEADLEDSSAISKSLLSPMQDLLVGRLHAANESAYIGRDGWLFFRPGIDYVTGRGFLDSEVLAARARSGGETKTPPQPDPVRAIVEFRDQLEARGIQLVLFPAPDKATIYPERFSGRYSGDAAPKNPSYAEFCARLDAAGVRYVDPTGAVMEAKRASEAGLYLATDTHWTPAGLDVAAKALARFVRESAPEVATDTTSFARAPVEVKNNGDIAAMLDLSEGQTFFPPETVTTMQVSTPAGAPWGPDPNAEILLLGDSFANIFSLEGMGWGARAGLAEQLSAELGAPLDTLLINDAGAHATREQLGRELQRGRDRLAGKKLVIWEFAMRELAVGDWKLLGLSLGAPDAPTPDQWTSSHVTGTVAALTRPPRAGSVPYKDCVITLHLTNLKGPNAPAAGIVVFLWGMRENVWTDAARLEVGETLDLDLVPWESVEARFGSYNRIELADENLLRLNTFWASTSDDARDATGTPTTAPAVTSAPTPTLATATTVKDITGTLEASGSSVWRGLDGWLYLASELRHLSAGPFWGAQAAAVSRAENPDFADPVPAIVDFSEQLKRAGIELILMPVPPKAVIYPEKIAGGLSDPNLGADLQTFYGVLRERGVTVIDLTETFRGLRASDADLLFCKQDTHWSSAACASAAKAVAAQLKGRDWLASDAPLQTTVEKQDLDMTGDLWRMLEDAGLAREVIPVYRVNDSATGKPVETNRQSPVLLLGDSHTLVYSEGADLYAANAGLRDHLARELEMAVDVVGVRGSGSTPARINLLRRRDNLAGKRAVIWCFAAREFTESTSGWRVLPVVGQTDQ